MIVLVLSYTLLALLLTCLCIAVRESRERKRRVSAQRAWSDRQLYQAERKLHQLASDTFGEMMEAARDTDEGMYQQ